MVTTTYIMERIESKKHDYRQYDFTPAENNAIMTFFDLAQEFDSIDDFYSLCVGIPKVFFHLDARLYLIDPKYNELLLVAQTEHPEEGLHTPPPPELQPNGTPYHQGHSLISTIRGKKSLIDQLPFKITDDVLGFLEVYPADELGLHQELFFEKFANRVGFNIHNRFLVEKNIEHLKFIRTLVADIEHNIIVPNMVYKLFLRRLKGKITKNKEIEELLSRCSAALPEGQTCLERIREEMRDVNHSLTDEFDNIEKHYRNMSLFLETLLRRSHFDQGRLIARTKQCNMKRDVVLPQLERYMEQFQDRGISVDDRSSGMPEEEIISVVDVGLMAQVYANLFSNALKYTEEVTTWSGEEIKCISYGHEIIRDFFGPGRDGVKFNVFSSGPHIKPEERGRLYEEEFRASNVDNKPGTGLGLAFIRNAVEIHGGVVGYEPTQYGNNFYFILPR